ncbi:MAG: O-antigen ligase family protein [Thermoguttaceae bacterium]
MNGTPHNPHGLPGISGNGYDTPQPQKGASPPVVLAGILVAAVVFVNEASFRDADPERFSVDWQVLLRLAVCGGCGLYAWNYLSAAWAALERFPAALISIFGIWCAITVPFAVNVPYAAVACGSLWCVILFAPVVVLHLGPKRLFIVVFGSLAAFAVISWFVYLIMPPLGAMEFDTVDGDVGSRLGGLSHPNGLGRQMAIMIVAGLFLGSRRMVSWRRLVPGLMLALITMYFANSRTSMLAMAAAAGLLCLHTAAVRGVLGKVVAATALAAVVLAIAALVQGGSHMDNVLGVLSRSGDSEEMTSFTGRTDIWRYAVTRIAESPVIGYGCGCCRFPMCQFDGFAINHAHNLLLNVMINTGVVGGLLLVAMFLAQVSQMFSRPSTFPDMMTVMVLVFGFADIPLFSVVPDAPTLLWIIAMVWRPLVEPLSVQMKEATA